MKRGCKEGTEPVDVGLRMNVKSSLMEHVGMNRTWRVVVWFFLLVLNAN